MTSKTKSIEILRELKESAFLLDEEPEAIEHAICALSEQLATVCSGCGQPWTGPCGQAENGWPTSPCVPVADDDAWRKHPQTVEAKRQWNEVATALGASGDDVDAVLAAAKRRTSAEPVAWLARFKEGGVKCVPRDYPGAFPVFA